MFGRSKRPEPTARAPLALELIQRSPGITADRLADKLGVTGRALLPMRRHPPRGGIPIESERPAAAPAPDRAAARPDPSTAALLVQACSRHRLVRLGYRSVAGSERVSDAEPWAAGVVDRPSTQCRDP